MIDQVGVAVINDTEYWIVDYESFDSGLVINVPEMTVAEVLSEELIQDSDDGVASEWKQEKDSRGQGVWYCTIHGKEFDDDGVFFPCEHERALFEYWRDQSDDNYAYWK